MGLTRIAYLIFLEHPWENLLKRQVLSILGEIAEESEHQVHLVSFLPLYQFIYNKEKIKNIERELKSNNIEFIAIPLPYPIPIYTPSTGWTTNWKYDWYRMILVFISVIPTLIYLYKFRKVRLFHCRSYPVSAPTMVFRRIVHNSRFIFDPRSDFPEENVTSGNWSTNSFNFKMWKYLERNICETADITIAIAESYEAHFKRFASGIRTEIVPNNVNTNEFRPDIDGEEEFRKQHDIKDSTTLICYSGSMLENSWNNPREYACALEKILQIDANIKFMFLIPEESNDVLVNSMRRKGINKNEYIIKNPDFQNVPKLLSYADLGIYILDNQSIRIGTKFVEYCASGLPTIVNDNIVGAANIIESNNLGSVISLNFEKEGTYCPEASLSHEEITDIKHTIYNSQEFSDGCREYARKNFDTEEIAKKYADLYRNVV